MKSIYDILDSLKGKRVAIDDLYGSYSSNMSSHKASWPYVIKSKCTHLGLEVDVLSSKDNIHNYDVWFVLHPMEFKGSLNYFSGAGDKEADRVQRFLDFKGEIYCVDQPIGDVGKLVKGRTDGTEKYLALDSDSMTSKALSIEPISFYLESDEMILGDSHSISVYKPGSNICRMDAKTLYGALKMGIHNLIHENTKHLTVYYGNIDIRHHLCGFSDPIEEAKKLVNALVDQLNSIEQLESYTIVQALPIEHEGRGMSKVTMHNGKPFNGPWALRTKVMRAFNNEIELLSFVHNFNVIKWPKSWYEMKPEEYATKCMEKPKSVHLSREYYQYDLVKNTKNQNLSEARALF